MPLKKDDAGNRYVEMLFEVPGTPEEVWKAIATGPGISAWFVPTDLEEREGGKIVFHLAPGMDSPGEVTGWDPPHRFGYVERNWNGDAPPIATEVTVEAKSGGICKVRMVHSLFTSRDDWDDQMESMEKGWPGYLRVLDIYMRHFRGEPAATVARPMGGYAGTHREAWAVLSQKLGLTGAKVGDRRDTSVDGGPRLVGVVEAVTSDAIQESITMRLEKPTSGVALIGTYAWAGQVHVAVSLYLYGKAAHATLEREGPVWSDWVARNFRPAAVVS